MPLAIDVSLLSGRTASVEAEPDESVAVLNSRAQKTLVVGSGRLLDSSAGILRAAATLEESGLQSGAALTLQLSSTVRTNIAACAAILGEWGGGGDCCALEQQLLLKDVCQIRASGWANAFVLDDGSVVTTGAADSGGDSSDVQHQLMDVKQIQASEEAFAAILGDGSVVTWGSTDHGGDSSAVQDQLKNVQQIQAHNTAFAAILGDGSVVTWGDTDNGGDSSAVQNELKGVQQIQATMSAFAAILRDGSVVTWGNAARGGDSSAVQRRVADPSNFGVFCCHSVRWVCCDLGPLWPRRRQQ